MTEDGYDTAGDTAEVDIVLSVRAGAGTAAGAGAGIRAGMGRAPVPAAGHRGDTGHAGAQRAGAAVRGIFRAGVRPSLAGGGPAVLLRAGVPAWRGGSVDARNVNGKVIMYADNITDSMQKTIDETARRRSIQLKYNADHGITPKQIVKAITSALPTSKEEGAKIVPMGAEGSKPRVYVEPESAAFVADPIVRSMSKEELEKSIANTTALMKQAAKDLDFMQAAQYRDEIIRLQKELEEKG